MALVNNMILAKFLGLCPFFGVSKKTKSAVSMGIAVLLVMIVSSAVTWPIYYYILVPYGVEVMKTVIFILVIASLVQIIEMAIKRTNLTLYNALGIYLPLITTNCAVLGITFINVDQTYTFLQSLFAAAGAGSGFLLVLLSCRGSASAWNFPIRQRRSRGRRLRSSRRCSLASPFSRSRGWYK